VSERVLSSAEALAQQAERLRREVDSFLGQIRIGWYCGRARPGLAL